MSKYIDNWTRQVLKGVAELALLNVVAQERRYGYEIVNLLSALGLDLSLGSVYPILSRLRKSGLVQAQMQETSGGPPRKYFHLTPLGETHLESMHRSWKRLAEGVQLSERLGDHK